MIELGETPEMVLCHLTRNTTTMMEAILWAKDDDLTTKVARLKHRAREFLQALEGLFPYEATRRQGDIHATPVPPDTGDVRPGV
jgi:hypothetical protein